jgi:hypothetical protein
MSNRRDQSENFEKVTAAEFTETLSWRALKGHGFSRAGKRNGIAGALAPEDAT